MPVWLISLHSIWPPDFGVESNSSFLFLLPRNCQSLFVYISQKRHMLIFLSACSYTMGLGPRKKCIRIFLVLAILLPTAARVSHQGAFWQQSSIQRPHSHSMLLYDQHCQGIYRASCIFGTSSSSTLQGFAVLICVWVPNRRVFSTLFCRVFCLFWATLHAPWCLQSTCR